jgi:hypothetical protein
MDRLAVIMVSFFWHSVGFTIAADRAGKGFEDGNRYDPRRPGTAS